MSSKSEKSLNEDISDVFETSFSARSPSPDDSIAGDIADDALASVLIRKLTPATISKLRKCFKKSRERDQDRELERRVETVMRQAAAEEGIEFARPTASDDDPLWLDEKGFISACCKIFGNSKYSTHSRALFRSLAGSGARARWCGLVRLLAAAGRRANTTRQENWVEIQHGTPRKMQHCKRETLVKLLSLEREDSFCYVAVTRGGRVGVYSGQMRLLHSYEIYYHRTGSSRRVKNSWITDAVYLPDVQSVMVSASDRSLSVYDASTVAHTLTYCITGMPNIPTCLSYQSGIECGTSELVVGTERGEIIHIRFLQPRLSLFYTQSTEKTNYYFWMELSSPPHRPYVATSQFRAHARCVCRARLAGRLLVSCALDKECSMRITQLAGKMEDYVYKVARGITCFHFIPTMHLIATGSKDGCVRLWDSTQTAATAELLAPPRLPVLDVAVLAAKELVVGYCSNCWLYIWDLNEECLLQTVKIKFPFLGVLGKKIEFGPYCIHPGPARKLSLEDEDPLPELVLLASSRRGSSVFLGSTGGLILQDEEDDEESKELKDDPEYLRFKGCELLVSCCDHICSVPLEPVAGEVLRAPGGTMRPRRPDSWDLPDHVFERPESPPAPRVPAASLLTPSMTSPMTSHNAELLHTDRHLDELLENAGLQGILEKDFVLMYGLKHDLNRKLAEMDANKGAVGMMSAVSMGAPYLALKITDTDAVVPVDEMTERYREVMKLFPGPSVVATPTGSELSTPRKRTSLRLQLP